jgi:hypothetical protein
MLRNTFKRTGNGDMSEELRIKYLFMNMRCSYYIKMQVATFLLCIALALIFYCFFGDSKSTPLRYLWALALLGAVIEAIETKLAIRKAKRSQDSRA